MKNDYQRVVSEGIYAHAFEGFDRVLSLAVVCISNSGETPVLAAARLARGNEELAGMFVEAWTERTRQGPALEGGSDSASDDRSARRVEPVGNYEGNH